jgi:hypothetical protein
MRIIKLTFALLTLASLVFLAGYFGGATSQAAAAGGRVNPHWKGASALTPAAVAPNPARCGPFPANIEITFTGGGIDTGGGIFTSDASTCVETATGRIFDLKSTDTYQSGDSVVIETDPFTPVLNPATCVSANVEAVGFRVAGGTGVYAGATGQGRFHFATNEPTCNGILAPGRVSFEGVLQLAQ